MLPATEDLPERFFLDPIWHALTTTHRHLTFATANAVRYHSDVGPFAAVRNPGGENFQQLRSLLSVGESVIVCSSPLPPTDGLVLLSEHLYPQMVIREGIELGPSNSDIVPLSCDNASEMAELSQIAFPEFLRSRSCAMGAFYGIRSNGALVAMGGNRWSFNGYAEISGLCTHPDHRGKGFAESLIWHILRTHREQSLVSFLHLAAENIAAMRLYLRLGFRQVRVLTGRKIGRSH